MHPMTPPPPRPGGSPPPPGGPAPYVDPPTEPRLPVRDPLPAAEDGGATATQAESEPQPGRSGFRPWLFAGVALVVVAAVIGAVLVSMGSGDGGPGIEAPLGPAESSEPGADRGRRPITEVEASPGRQLTVAQDGSGEFGTIGDAAAVAQPGDTVVIASGTYEGELEIPTDGAPGAYITYHAAPGADVVLTGDPDDQGLVQLEDRQWIRFVGITIRDSSAHGLYAVRSSHIVLRDVEIDGTQDGGAVFVDGSDVQVLHSEVRGTNSRGLDAANEAVSFSNVDGFEIAWSVVEDNGEEGIDAKYEARNGSIHDNLTRANRGPNIYIDGANTIQVYNNEIRDATAETKAGISLGIEDISETRRTYAIDIYNNVISGNDGGISFFVESEGTFEDLTIVNNTIVDNSGDGINPRDLSFAGTNVLRNNIVTGNDDDSAGDMSVFVADHNLFGSGPVGADPVVGAVEFVDADGGDLRLAEGSAGIGVGSSEGVPQVDLLGTQRAADGVDLGAYQSGGEPPS